MKALGFFYDWSGRRRLDPYFRQFAGAFEQLGFDLEIVLANELLHPAGGQETWNPLVDEDKLVAFVAERQPDLIFSVNNAGMTRRVEEATRAPIIKWLVDDLPHLFFHETFGDASRHFTGREHIVCYSSTLAAQVEAAFPQTRGRVSWVSHGSDMAGCRAESLDPSYPIGFVGSCLPVRPVIDLLAGDAGIADEVLGHLSALRRDYVTASRTIAPRPALRERLAERGFTVLDYHRILADTVTTQNRTEGLRRVADLGLHLWGNALWLESLSCTADLAERFQFANPITTPGQLVETYARSRISVNIPNVQNCAGLAARVFDAMASSSLLVTEYHPDSDLFRLFGPDCPVPMYRSFDHLRELCAHYLAHEDERLAVVAKCNRLVDERFRLTGRLRAILASGGVAVPATPATAAPLRIVPARAFHGLPRQRHRVLPWVRLTGRMAATAALQPIVGPLRRWVRRRG